MRAAASSRAWRAEAADAHGAAREKILRGLGALTGRLPGWNPLDLPPGEPRPDTSWNPCAPLRAHGDGKSAGPLSQVEPAQEERPPPVWNAELSFSSFSARPQAAVGPADPGQGGRAVKRRLYPRGAIRPGADVGHGRADASGAVRPATRRRRIQAGDLTRVRGDRCPTVLALGDKCRKSVSLPAWRHASRGRLRTSRLARTACRARAPGSRRSWRSSLRGSHSRVCR